MGFSLCTHVFSRTVAAVDTERGYVGICIDIIDVSILSMHVYNTYGICNGRSEQQECGAEQHVYGRGLKLYTAIILGVH